jgi:hypothetical protein
MCSPGSSRARNISTREQLRSNRSNTGTAVLPRRSILNETVGGSEECGYAEDDSHSRCDHLLACRPFAWRRSRFWRRRFRTPWVGAGPWRFRGARVRDEPSGFGHGRFEAHCLRSGLPPERRGVMGISNTPYPPRGPALFAASTPQPQQGPTSASVASRLCIEQ